MTPQIDPLLTPRLQVFLGLLDQWNKVHALTALPADQRWEELVLDSAALLPHLAALPPGSRLGDFGTGLGMPAVLLALARPDLKVLALDKSRKKCAFVRQATLELGLSNLEVLPGRFEDHSPLGLVAGVAKALGSFDLLIKWWSRHGTPGGPFFALKGQRDFLVQPPPGWRLEGTPYKLPTRGERTVVRMEKGAV